jgi:hypothetical protein
MTMGDPALTARSRNWKYTRQLAAVRAALKDIAKKRLLGDIKFDYDQIILIARKALAGEEE